MIFFDNLTSVDLMLTKKSSSLSIDLIYLNIYRILVKRKSSCNIEQDDTIQELETYMFNLSLFRMSNVNCNRTNFLSVNYILIILSNNTKISSEQQLLLFFLQINFYHTFLGFLFARISICKSPISSNHLRYKRWYFIGFWNYFGSRLAPLSAHILWI